MFLPSTHTRATWTQLTLLSWVPLCCMTCSRHTRPSPSTWPSSTCVKTLYSSSSLNTMHRFVLLSVCQSVCLSTHLTDCESVYVFASLSVSTSSLWLILHLLSQTLEMCTCIVKCLLGKTCAVMHKIERDFIFSLSYITLTLHYITLHYITLHYITLHYTTLHYTTLHYTTLHLHTLHYITHTHTHLAPPKTRWVWHRWSHTSKPCSSQSPWGYRQHIGQPQVWPWHPGLRGQQPPAPGHPEGGRLCCLLPHQERGQHYHGKEEHTGDPTPPCRFLQPLPG